MNCMFVVSLIFKMHVNFGLLKRMPIKEHRLYPVLKFTIKLVANSFYLNSSSLIIAIVCAYVKKKNEFFVAFFATINIRDFLLRPCLFEHFTLE